MRQFTCSFSESFLDFGALIVFSTLVFPHYFVGLTLAPTCRSDGGISVPRWPWSLQGDCAPAFGLSPVGPVERSVRPALSDPVLLYRDYSGLSRPRAPQRAEEHSPQHRETVSIGKEERFKSAASLYAAHKIRSPTTIQKLKFIILFRKGSILN